MQDVPGARDVDSWESEARARYIGTLNDHKFKTVKTGNAKLCWPDAKPSLDHERLRTIRRRLQLRCVPAKLIQPNAVALPLNEAIWRPHWTLCSGNSKSKVPDLRFREFTVFGSNPHSLEVVPSFTCGVAELLRHPLPIVAEVSGCNFPWGPVSAGHDQIVGPL